jgi:hypothetical protein
MAMKAGETLQGTALGQDLRYSMVLSYGKFSVSGEDFYIPQAQK